MHQTFRLLSLHTILNMTDRLRDIAGWRSEGRREEKEGHACQAARARERERVVEEESRAESVAVSLAMSQEICEADH